MHEVKGQILIRPSKDKSELEIIIRWKKKVYSQTGFGGIKDRIMQFIREDLEKMEKQKI